MNTPVVDFHSHGSLPEPFDLFVEKYVRIMDAAGVDISIMNTLGLSSDAVRSNDLTAAFMAKYPDRFVGMANVNARYVDEALPELDRAFNKLSMKCLKIYPDVGPINGKSYFPIYEWCNDRGIAIMSHSEYFSENGHTDSAPRLFASG